MILKDTTSLSVTNMRALYSAQQLHQHVSISPRTLYLDLDASGDKHYHIGALSKLSFPPYTRLGIHLHLCGRVCLAITRGSLCLLGHPTESSVLYWSRQKPRPPNTEGCLVVTSPEL